MHGTMDRLSVHTASSAASTSNVGGSGSNRVTAFVGTKTGRASEGACCSAAPTLLYLPAGLPLLQFGVFLTRHEIICSAALLHMPHPNLHSYVTAESLRRHRRQAALVVQPSHLRDPLALACC